MLRLGLNGVNDGGDNSSINPANSESINHNLTAKEKADREKDVTECSSQIMYSRRYYDEEFEYRYVAPLIMRVSYPSALLGM